MTTKRQLLRIIERERVAFAQERAMLLDRIADLAGRPWMPAPSSMPGPVVREPKPELDAAMRSVLEQLQEL